MNAFPNDYQEGPQLEKQPLDDRRQLPRGVSPTYMGRPYRFHWAYKDRRGDVRGYAVRYDNPDDPKDKAVLPYFIQEGGKWLNRAGPTPRMLYGLHSLPDDIKAPIYIAEGEKCATAIHYLSQPCVTSPQGAKSAHVADWSPLADYERFYLLADIDPEGERYCRDVAAHLLRQNPRAAVFVLRFPGLREGEDVADWLQKTVADWDGFEPLPREPGDNLEIEFAETVEANTLPIPSDWGAVPAVKLTDQEPIPLRREPPRPAPYPLDALGEVLGSAAEVIAHIVQADPAIVANSLIAGASLAVQGHADVVVDGRTVPTSIFALSVAESGDRKSSVDRVVLAPHREHQQKRMTEYEEQMQEYRNELAIYKKEHDQILKSRHPTHGKREELKLLGPEPIPPPIPALLIDDFTPEGVRRALRVGQPSLGLFTDEGARVVGGNAMLPENSLKTLGILSKLWDGNGDITVRAGEGVIPLFGKRVSIHWMMQPSVAPYLLANTEAQGQGFLWRCLVSWPESLNGSRKYVGADVIGYAAYRKYYAQALKGLQTPLPVRPDTTDVIPRQLALSSSAKQLYVGFYNELEAGRGPDGVWSSVSAYAARCAEHALRLAGVLTLMENLDAESVGKVEMASAIRLALWYLRECHRIIEAGAVDPEILLAEKLLGWMTKQEQPVTTRRVTQFGPYACRTADAARRTLAILQRHDLVVPEAGRKEAWRVVG